MNSKRGCQCHPLTKRLLMCRKRVCDRSAGCSRGHERQHFAKVLKRLRVLLPPAFPVSVQTGRRLRANDGDCARLGRRFHIRICKSLGDAAATDVLLHEWAHALAWNHALDVHAKTSLTTDLEFEAMAHGPEWGCAYSRVYATYATQIAPQLAAISAATSTAQPLGRHKPSRERSGHSRRMCFDPGRILGVAHPPRNESPASHVTRAAQRTPRPAVGTAPLAGLASDGPGRSPAGSRACYGDGVGAKRSSEGGCGGRPE